MLPGRSVAPSMTSSRKPAARRGLAVFGALVVLLLGLGLWQLGGAGWIHAQTGAAQALLENAWAARLSEGKTLQPWPGAITHPVARLEVPSLDVELIVLSGASKRTLAFGPGHIDGTVPPGEAGHSILTGDRDTHFDFLQKLKPGTLLWIQRVDSGWRRYRVVDAEVLDSREAQLASGSGWPVLSLVTELSSGPAEDSTPWRYVVTAEAVTDVALGH